MSANRSGRRWAGLATATVIALLAKGVWAHASDDPDADVDDELPATMGDGGAEPDEFAGLETLTVTAQKRAENLQEVPTPGQPTSC